MSEDVLNIRSEHLRDITVIQAAPDGTRFTPDAFASSIGHAVPFKIDGVAVGGAFCTVTAAEVAEDGMSVQLTLDAPQAVVDQINRSSAPMSFGTVEDTKDLLGWHRNGSS